MNTLHLQIAGWHLEVVCWKNFTENLPHFKPFVVSSISNSPSLCRIETGVSLNPKIGPPTITQELEGRKLSLWILPDSCFASLTIHNTGQTYHLQTDRQWNTVTTDCFLNTKDSDIALNDFIMLSFIYSSAFFKTVMIHASSIILNDSGCAFIGPSGVGKSTHSQLWLQHISGSQLLNDDQPILRLMPDGAIYIYGSPWSGKTPCYKNKGVRLCTLFFMQQAQENRTIPLSGIPTFQKLLEATSLTGHDIKSFAEISNTLAHIAECIPAYIFENIPNREAAEKSYNLFVASCNKNKS